jgi:hypothetical protein
MVTISQNGIVSKTALLSLGIGLLSYGAYDIRTMPDLMRGTVEILLGGFILFVREFCKSIPDGEQINRDPKKKIW